MKGDLDALESEKKGYEDERDSILAKIAEAEKEKAGILEEIEKINAKLSELLKLLATNKEKCQDIREEKMKKELEKEKAE